jgi:hypothetical protein
MRDVVECQRWWRDVVKWRRWWWWGGGCWRWGGVVVWLMLPLVEWRFLPLFLLAKDVDSVLQLYKPCLLFVDVLPLGFSMLISCLPSHDGFLFLLKPLVRVMYPGYRGSPVLTQ